MSGNGQAARKVGAPTRQSNPQMSREALALATPGPGQSVCPLCTRPGYAVLDARGVKIYHNAPWPCRVGGRFADLVTVADPQRQARWHDAAPGEVCPRCSHLRSGHYPLEVSDPVADPTMCASCECPGPAAITPTRLENP